MMTYLSYLVRLEFVIALACCCSAPSVVFAQAGLRESLERLDRDGDGHIEPEEITTLSRSYIERVASVGGLSMSSDIPIGDFLVAAQRYHTQQSASSRRSEQPSAEGTIKPFVAAPNRPLVPEFGIPSQRHPYTQVDLDAADQLLRRLDQNSDGFIDRTEAQRSSWDRDPFDDDPNADDRLGRLELAYRSARLRMLENAVEEVPRQSWRPAVDSASSGSSSNREDRYSWRRGGSSYWLSASVLERFDANQNGRLEAQETQTMGLPVGQIDIDRDGALSRDELFAYLSPIQEEAGQLSEGIPGWFFEFDSDRDRQVSMAEFSSVWTPEQMNTFTSLDLNGDGLLTIAEVSRSKALMGGSFVNRNAEVLPPGKTVISEIEITDDIIIADLNVQLSITHTNAAHLDGFLTGPDGQRIELFTEVGGSDNNFDETIFDDQAELPIVKAAPPFKGSFIPEAVVKHEPSLSHFTGKNAKGVWQLVIRGTRSERFGMLHGWSLMIRLEEQRPVAQAVVATEPIALSSPTP